MITRLRRWWADYKARWSDAIAKIRAAWAEFQAERRNRRG